MSVFRVTDEWLREYQARAATWKDNLAPVTALRRAPRPKAPICPTTTADARSVSPDTAVTRAALAAGYAPLVGMCRSAGLPEPVPEWRFHPIRRWRFDYAFPLHKLALEIEGGLWVNGRHSRGAGAIADLEKYSEAAILGWRVLYATPDELRSGVALDRVQRALGYRAPEAA